MYSRIILSNDRDQRTLNWLLETVGKEAIENALAGLAGERKPYLSNVCKILEITPPKNLEKTDKNTALEKLAQLKAKFDLDGV